MSILNPLFLFIFAIWSITCMALPFLIYWLVRARKEMQKLDLEIELLKEDVYVTKAAQGLEDHQILH